MRVNDLFKFIRARHCIYLMREAGNHKPWTGDPILQKYRFCNVYRELDAVTIWINQNWRTPNQNDKDLWFAMVVARLFNNPDTLHDIGYPVPFEAGRLSIIEGILRQRKEDGLRIFNPAYIVSTNGVAMDKVDYLMERVLKPMWESRNVQWFVPEAHLEVLHKRLMSYIGMGSFLAAQVIADVKYAAPYLNSPDWYTFAASGPGSRRGLNRVMGRHVDSGWNEYKWRSDLEFLRNEINPSMRKHEYPELHAQDLQNCLCEFDKYERVRLGEGRPKQLYDGA